MEKERSYRVVIRHFASKEADILLAGPFRERTEADALAEKMCREVELAPGHYLCVKETILGER